jgi:CRISPR-associated exonuclease Cas4
MTNREFTADELLPLSGIQHFSFCRRQWALIHVERIWHENVLTAEGRLLHERSDDAFDTEIRKGVLTSRAMPVASYQLGLYGVCDVVEFIPMEGGIELPHHRGAFRPQPVEFKRGTDKLEDCDRLQVCAQAMCLEEMLLTGVPIGFLFYGEPRRRVEVELRADLREEVRQMAAEMHAYFGRGYTPRVKTSKACRSCSLADDCLPRLQTRTSASVYIRQQINGEEG